MHSHPLLLTFFRFDYHVFFEFTICLLKNPSPYIPHFFAIWAPIFSTINKFFTFTNSNCKMTTKKGHDDTTEKSVYVMPYLDGQCSHPSYQVDISSFPACFTGRWSACPADGMLCTIHKLFNCLLSFLDCVKNLHEILWAHYIRVLIHFQ